ncbi:MAG: hypothetical protein ABI035_11205 [Gemmatimonadaceae bacterium]
MRANQIDNRGRWIIIGGTMGATLGAGGHHLPIGLALGVAFGMMIGHYMNKLTMHRR